MIEELTEEQIALFPVQVEKWVKIGLTTGEVDRIKAEEAINLAYKCADLKPPQNFYWESNPVKAIYKAAALVAGDRVITKEDCYNVRNGVCFGQFEAGWLSRIEFFKDVVGVSKLEKIEGLIAVAKHVSWWIPHDEFCVYCTHPQLIQRDDRFRLHNDSGPALVYDEDFKMYSIHGTIVPEFVVMEPEKNTIDAIQEESNVEVRRVMIDRYGIQKYLLDSKAEKIHVDDFGTLWKKQIPEDEPLVMIQLLNSTKEPDGSRKNYFLRVPPNMETAHQAVAWSFGKDIKSYQPAIES